MVPDRDYYADKNGKLTDDPTQYAFQVGVKGCFLDPRVASRYGIGNELVSVNEPAAPRRVTGRNEASVKIVRAEEKEGSVPPASAGEDSDKPQEPAEAAGSKANEPKADKPKAEAKKPAAKKGEKSK